MKKLNPIWVWLACGFAILGLGGYFFVTFKNRKDFLNAISPDALRLQDLTGIKTKITFTQASLESGDGSNTLTKEAHNIFSIKKSSNWTGPTFILPKDGQEYKSYPDFFSAMQDWASTLARLYPAALAAAKVGDINAFAAGLQKGVIGSDGKPLVYAEDKKYYVELVDRRAGIDQALA